MAQSPTATFIEASLLVVGVAGVIALALALRRRKMRRFDALCAELGLRRAVPVESGWETFRRRGRPRFPDRFAMGTRHGIGVELLMVDGGEDSNDETTVVALGQRPVQRAWRISPKRSWLDTPVFAEVRTAVLGALGECWLYGLEPHEAAGLLSAEMQAALAAFPRRSLTFGFEEAGCFLEWNAIEKDATVIEQAFAIVTRCQGPTSWYSGRPEP